MRWFRHGGKTFIIAEYYLTRKRSLSMRPATEKTINRQEQLFEAMKINYIIQNF